MSLKQLVFIVDDFSSNSVDYYEQAYGNITFFDYSDFQVERHWDFAYDGYGDPIDYYQVISDYGNDYLHVRYDSDLEWYYSIDNDYINNWTYGYHPTYGYGYYKDSYTTYGVNSSSDDSIQHGDWVLSSFFDQIDDPSSF
jgi:hypothetical protein